MANIEEQLRTAARRSGLSMRQLALRSNCGYQSVHGFVTESRGLSLTVAARLAATLGLELRPVRHGKQKGR